MRMVGMHSESDEPLVRWVMPEHLRARLARVSGEIVEPKHLKSFNPSNIVCVGDVCTINLLENGIRAKVFIVDYSTKRYPMGEAKARILALIGHEKIFWRVKDELNMALPDDCWLGMRVRNPRSTLTQELWEAVELGLRIKNCALIVVEGEEDLAALACIALAPLGTKVIYGIPDVGMQLLNVDENLKQKVMDVLKEMEVQRWK